MLEAAAALAPIDLEANVEALLEIQAFTPGRVSVGVDCTDHLRRREGETNGQRMLHYRGDTKTFFVRVESRGSLGVKQ